MSETTDLSALVAAYLTPDPVDPDAAAALRAKGPAVVPALAAAYGMAPQWRQRAALLVAATVHARRSDAAVALGLQALQDRASAVRYRACGLLAYAGRPETVTALAALRTHSDAATRADAAAAITAITTRNHHRFVDRAGVGGITWAVNASDPEAPDGPPSLWAAWRAHWGHWWRHLMMRRS